MTTERWNRVKEVFQAALGLPPQERPQYLREACNADSGLFAEVHALLESANAEEFLSDAAVAWAPGALAGIRDPNVGRSIGAYRIIRQIGEGGMGAVYLAERSGDFEHRAAVKLLRAGMDSRGIVTRFLQERSILAGLDHPNIARLLDGGTTEEGRPYFIMEYIEGQPIDVYANEKGLGIRPRLELFRKVCAAVQYAHQNLVVHRDVKPSNILVTAAGAPKLLDFGIAKLLKGDAPGEGDSLTRFGLRVMTPEYASPEQIRGGPVTTATDVYSLGVVLYRILTGRMPYDFPSRSTGEMERVVCETNAQTPSRVAERATARQLRGDLDSIVLKALQKDPRRRYGSVEQLNEDLRRHLDGTPIHARPQTLAYRTGRFVARNRLAVAFACLFAVIVITAASLLFWQARRVQKESLQNAQLSDFLQSVMGMSSDRDLSPLRQNFRTTPMIDVIRYGAGRLDAAMAGQPAAQARLSALFSLALSENGSYADADRVAHRGLELVDRHKDPALAALVLYSLGRSHLLQGVLREPYAELDEAVRLMDQPSAEARSLDKALILTHFLWASMTLNGGTRTPALDRILDRALAEAGRRDGEASPTYATVLASEAIRYLDEDHTSEAERAVERAMSIQKSLRALPEEYNWTLKALAYLRRNQGRLAEALELKAQECAWEESVYGRANSLFQMCRMELGNWQSRKGDVEATVKILGEVGGELPQALPRALWLRAWVLYFRSQALLKLGRKNEGKSDLETCYSLTRQEWGEKSEFTRAVAGALAQVSAPAATP